MKKSNNFIFYGFFFTTISIILYELFTIVKYHQKLSDGYLNIPKDSATYEMAKKIKDDFINSQISASHTKYRSVSADLLKHSIYIFVAVCFLNKKLRNHVLRISEKRITIIRSDFRDLKRSEINYISLAVIAYFTCILIISMIKSKEIDTIKLGQYICLFFGFYFFLIPFIVFIIYVALKNFGKKFIAACYIAYILKVLPEVLVQDEADLEKMKKMNIEEFPEKIQNVLKKYDLEDRVYKERTPSADINAALIGYGSGKRMELYGDMNDFSRNQIYAILLHEVGHVDEHSLFRKSVIYFGLIFAEMFFLMWMYDRLSYKYTSNGVSAFTAFIFLTIIYKILLRQWLFAFHRMASQNSELNSDHFAREHSYFEPLAEALFNIGVDSHDYLKPTWPYNVLRSTHPSIYSRVERLLR
ncbi:hypothetical protein EDEG_01924 [Edhazardia aedis USNM 41457]|uniref:Peptidase M48 domain-containing protein n=1 Tax=Edhazardia aedis (strain USNM 41457) TaxID=1003232 RepID=J9DMH0_EDHAE|nr:hypothetical protein EDEG_01924 [Edhazardia aedis USNM 41457]|eukprot:EJW03795.1 hypothetical protein EDEG_01924 [Edhazardia aedis USNM 41457]